MYGVFWHQIAHHSLFTGKIIIYMPSVPGIKIIKNPVPQWHKENRCVSETSASPSACVVNYICMIGSSCVMKKIWWWVFVKNWKLDDVLGWRFWRGRIPPTDFFLCPCRERERERALNLIKPPPGKYLCLCNVVKCMS